MSSIPASGLGSTGSYDPDAEMCVAPPPPPLVCEAPEGSAGAPVDAGAAGSATDAAAAAWQARLEAVNRGPGEPTALQRHVLFFDTNKDGQLSVKEVRRGLERIGMDSWVERVFASTVNNALLGGPTRDRLISFKVDVANIHKAKHEGSNTGIYDPAGHFSPAKFEEMWTRFDKDGDGRLTAAEVQHMVDVNTAGMSSRSRGRFSAQAEFDLLMKLCAFETPGSGERYVTRERMLSFYDGRIFDELAAEVQMFGSIVRQPVHDDKAFGASGTLPELALRGAGPAAGPAAGAAYGESLLDAPDPEDAALGAASTAVLGGMMAVCPYAGQGMPAGDVGPAAAAGGAAQAGGGSQ